jgi:transcriptional regulator with AAA-type ATPase domain
MPVSPEGYIISKICFALEDLENALPRKTLEMSNGNQIKAAKLHQMSRHAFRRSMNGPSSFELEPFQQF